MAHLKNFTSSPTDEELAKLENSYVALDESQKHLIYKTEPEYVEIAGLKWMKYTLGASAELERGLYYPWGGSNGYEGNISANCRLSTDTEEIINTVDGGDNPLSNKFYNKTLSTLQNPPHYIKNGRLSVVEDGYTVVSDVVSRTYGNGWRMPTVAECQALIDACTIGIFSPVGREPIYTLTETKTGNKLKFLLTCGSIWTNEIVDGGGDGSQLITKAQIFDMPNRKIMDRPNYSFFSIRGVHDL